MCVPVFFVGWMEGVGRGKEDVGVEGLVGRGSNTTKGRLGRLDGWMDGFRRSGRQAGASPKLLGKAATIGRDTKKERGSREERKSHACSGETWQGFPSFVCLAQGCSARGNQEMSRRGGGGGGGGGGGWGQALHRLRKDEREKSTFKRLETQLLKGLWQPKKQNKRFSHFERFSALEPLKPAEVSETNSTISDNPACNLNSSKYSVYCIYIFSKSETTSLNRTRTDV